MILIRELGGNELDFVRIATELVVGFFALLILTKVLGKTQMSQITAFDFISALVLGELVGNALYDKDIGLMEILFAVFLWGLLIYTTEKITQKYRRTRPLLEGGPSIVINKGIIDANALNRNHLDINQLQLLLRQSGIFSIQECQYAILETNGTVSVLKKANYDYVTKGDLQIHTSEPELAMTIILDGEIVKDNLETIQWTEKQLTEEVKKQGLASVKDVLLAEWIDSKGLYVQPYKNTFKN